VAALPNRAVFELPGILDGILRTDVPASSG
jgi:hypothetical protein